MTLPGAAAATPHPPTLPAPARPGSRTGPAALVGLLAVAALVRLAGFLSPGHGGDLTAFVWWAEDAASNGLGGYYAAGGDANYPPMLYLLWPLGVALDGDALVFAIRLLSIPFDLALGFLLYRVVVDVTGRDRGGLLAAAFYLFNPAVVLVGPMWGQVDGMGALPMVGAVVAGARGRPVVAGSLAVIAGLVKPQFGIAGFVLAGLAIAWLGQRGGFRQAAVLALSAFVTFLAVLAPLGLGPSGYLAVMADTFTRYPYISQFGFNPWAVFFGFSENDAAWAGIGTALGAAGIALSLVLLRWRRDLTGLLAVGALIGLAIYFLPTRVHERYLFGALACLVPLAVLDRRVRWPFYALSAAFFLTLAYVLVTSPYRILPTPKLDELPDWAISVASIAVTAVGAWTAAALVVLFRDGTGGPADREQRTAAGWAGPG